MEREVSIALEKTLIDARRLAELSLHQIDDKCLLLDRSGERLYALNDCAATIWALLKSGKSPVDVRKRLKQDWAVPASDATDYMVQFLRQYDSLLRDGKTLTEPTTDALPKDRRRRRQKMGAVVQTYPLLSSNFRVHYETAELADAIRPLLEFNASNSGAQPQNITNVVAIRRHSGVAIRVNDEEIGSSRTLEDAAVLMRACLTELAIKESGGLCAIHSGALRRDGAGLLLPGGAGHGKSTLAAGLALRGFEMLCDDTTLLAGAPPVAACIPTGLCIKRGAYAVLQHGYPQLLSLPEWHRPDGKRARYLMPDAGLRWAPPAAVAKIRWIVFPHYHRDHETKLVTLAKDEALLRLLPGTYFLSGSLDEQNLDRLIDWIQQIDCFELPLSNLDAATALLGQLCT